MEWEYRIENLADTENAARDQRFLNLWGADGWELVAVVGIRAYLKRQKPMR